VDKVGRKLGVLIALAAVLVLSSCQTGQTMWGVCTTGAGGDPFGTDGTYVLNCENGMWHPIMTVGEYLQVLQHKPVTIAPLPQAPLGIPIGPAPTLTTITPDVVSPLGGTLVTLRGTNFNSYTLVLFGLHAGMDETFVNSTTITIRAPAGTLGTSTVVTVRNPDGKTSNALPIAFGPQVPNPNQ
jgi:hypothetical protein